MSTCSYAHPPRRLFLWLTQRVAVPSTSKAVEGTETVLGTELEDAVEAVELEEMVERLSVLDLDSNFEEQALILDAE